MDAVIFADTTQEYRELSALLGTAAPAVRIIPEISEEQYRTEAPAPCGLEIVALDGARGMETVTDHRKRFPDARILWITGDPYFAGVAIRTHVSGFLTRPLSAVLFREAVEKAMQSPECGF